MWEKIWRRREGRRWSEAYEKKGESAWEGEGEKGRE
jgi:hypothetical protein